MHQKESSMAFASRLLLALATVLLAIPAQAQTYPTRPIRLIVPIAVGSVTDVIMRAAAIELASGLSPIIVENKGGASGIPGAQSCAQAQPDGYTICLVYHSTMSINPLIFDKLPYDPDTDFVPITNLFLLVEGLFVSSSLGVDSVAALKAAAQAKPNAFNYGTLGPGSYPDLFLRWVNKEWSTDIVGIPYRGGGPIAQELVAGQLQIAKMGVGNFLGLLATGKIKPLAVTSTKRSPLLPDVPTFAEAGLPYPGFGWWGLAAPKSTPAAIVAKLNAEFVRVFRDPKFMAFLEKQAVVPAAGSQAEFIAFLKQDRIDAAGLIKIANTPKSEYKPD
jgi:tripartite-type tricarboxylate transporter receptor subunit TctC